MKGIVIGAFGEGSEPLHELIHHIAKSRVRVAGPQVGKKGQLRTEQAEIAIATSFLRRTLSVCGVKGQASTLLGRLELLGPGTAAAMNRRNYSLLLEQRWSQLRQAHTLSVQQGKSILRRGHLNPV